MNLQEIVSRKTMQHVTQEEMEYVVKNYIKELKGVDININISKGINPRSMSGKMRLSMQLELLFMAFNDASKYYLKK